MTVLHCSTVVVKPRTCRHALHTLFLSWKLWGNTGYDIDVAKHLEGDWFLPTSECRTWTKTAWRWRTCSNAAKSKCKYMQNFQDGCCSTDTGMKNFAPWWFLSPTIGTTPVTRRWRQPRTIFWMAATMDTHSSSYSVERWSSIYLGWYCQHKELALLGTQNSIRMWMQNVILNRDYQLTCDVDY